MGTDQLFKPLHYGWEEQVRFRYRPRDPAERARLCGPGILGKQFPERKPTDYVFPSERYGASGDDFTACAYKTDPTKPIGRWKEAWETARTRAGVQCRFHDLRHTGCTRMLEAGAPFPLVARIMGWSTATTVRMAKRYGHIGHEALRSAVESISAAKAEQKSKKQGEQKQQGSFDNPFDLNAETDGKVRN